MQPLNRNVGVDVSEQMLAIAQQKFHPFPTASFQIANASALAFADHSFDAAVSANAFHYFDDPMLSLKEMRRVLDDRPLGDRFTLSRKTVTCLTLQIQENV